MPITMISKYPWIIHEPTPFTPHSPWRPNRIRGNKGKRGKDIADFMNNPGKERR